MPVTKEQANDSARYEQIIPASWARCYCFFYWLKNEYEKYPNKGFFRYLEHDSKIDFNKEIEERFTLIRPKTEDEKTIYYENESDNTTNIEEDYSYSTTTNDIISALCNGICRHNETNSFTEEIGKYNDSINFNDGIINTFTSYIYKLQNVIQVAFEIDIIKSSISSQTENDIKQLLLNCEISLEFLKNVKTMTSSQCLEFLNKKGIKVKLSDYIIDGTLITRQNIDEEFGWHWPWPWHNMFFVEDKYKKISKLPESYGLFFYVFFCVSVWSEPLFYMDVWPDYGTQISRYGWIDCLRSLTPEWLQYKKSNIDEEEKQLLSNFLERSTFEDVIKSDALSNSFCSLRKPLWSEEEINKAINYARWQKANPYAYLSNLYMILDKEIAYLTTEGGELSGQFENDLFSEIIRARHEAERDRAIELNQIFFHSFTTHNIKEIDFIYFCESERFKNSQEFTYKDKPALNSFVVKKLISHYIENDTAILENIKVVLKRSGISEVAPFLFYVTGGKWRQLGRADSGNNGLRSEEINGSDIDKTGKEIFIYNVLAKAREDNLINDNNEIISGKRTALANQLVQYKFVGVNGGLDNYIKGKNIDVLNDKDLKDIASQYLSFDKFNGIFHGVEGRDLKRAFLNNNARMHHNLCSFLNDFQKDLVSGKL